MKKEFISKQYLFKVIWDVTLAKIYALQLASFSIKYKYWNSIYQQLLTHAVFHSYYSS